MSALGIPTPKFPSKKRKRKEKSGGLQAVVQCYGTEHKKPNREMGQFY